MPTTAELGDRLRAIKRERGCKRCGRKYRLVKGRMGIVKQRPLQLQFAHVAPTPCVGRGRGLRARYYDIVKHNPQAYEVMCRGCHAAFDLGLLAVGVRLSA